MGARRAVHLLEEAVLLANGTPGALEEAVPHPSSSSSSSCLRAMGVVLPVLHLPTLLLLLQPLLRQSRGLLGVLPLPLLLLPPFLLLLLLLLLLLQRQHQLLGPFLKAHHAQGPCLLLPSFGLRTHSPQLAQDKGEAFGRFPRGFHQEGLGGGHDELVL